MKANMNCDNPVFKNRFEFHAIRKLFGIFPYERGIALESIVAR